MATTHHNLSNGDGDGPTKVMAEFNLRKKIASRMNRLKFLKDCIAEQVLPASAPAQLKQGSTAFTTAAKAYLEEACRELKYKLNVLLHERGETNIPQHLEAKLRTNNEQQQRNLKRKLHELCKRSPWTRAGNTDIVNNFSSRNLTNTEKEALSLGLKFDTGKDRSSFIDLVNRNYRWDESEVERGFIQRVLTCCKALADKEGNSMPLRYYQALQTLAKDTNIVITQADKGGGIVILDKTEYNQKMQDLLESENTYEGKPDGFAKKSSMSFNKNARRLLKKSDKGKMLLHLLEEAPTAPKMRGVPKIHKDGRPMRPITSGVGSAPHRLAKILAKPLTKTMGSISDSHLRNSSDMMSRLENINFNGKRLASLDVKALFTNVSVEGAMRAIHTAVGSTDDRQLPLPRRDYLDLVELCLKLKVFTFEGHEYVQQHGLAMGSPLSPAAACLYMETLEEEHFKNIMGPDATWLRYVDDVLVIIPNNMDLEPKVQRLNAVEHKIQFSTENETMGRLAFLDTEIIRDGPNAKYKVYRKPTSKEDYIHFYSGHHIRYKRGVVIGFFLRAYRICSPEYLTDELAHIFSKFTELMYPKGLLIQLKRKAQEIWSRPPSSRTREARNKDSEPTGRISIPNFGGVDTIAKALEDTGIKVAITTGRKSGEILKGGQRSKELNTASVVYQIPCGGCQKSYVGETGRGLKTRLAEHRRDVRDHRQSNAIVLHMEETDHLPRWENASVLQKCPNKQHRRALEAAYIRLHETTNTRAGFYTLSKFAAKIALHRR